MIGILIVDAVITCHIIKIGLVICLCQVHQDMFTPVLGKVLGTVLTFRLGWDFCRPRLGTSGIDSGQFFVRTGI